MFKLKQYSNGFISSMLVILLTFSFIGSVTQLGIIQNTSLINKSYFLLFVIMICLIVSLLNFKLIKRSISFVTSHKYIYYGVIFISLLLLIVYQINLIYALTGTMQLDPADVYGIASHNPVVNSAYFSFYPNNILIANMEHLLYIIFGKPTLLRFLTYLNYLNLLLIDSAIVFLYETSTLLFNKKIGMFSWFISIILFGITPNIVVPYTDNWAFWGVSLWIFLATLIIKRFCQYNNFIISSLTLSIGILSAFLYKIKPSSFIICIASIIILMIVFICNKRIDFLINNKLPILSLLISFVCALSFFTYTNNHTTLTKIDTSQGAPMYHFIAMGLHKDPYNNVYGGYWFYLDSHDQAHRPKHRKQYEMTIIKKDLSQLKSPASLFDFIAHKQSDNSSLASWTRHTTVNHGPVGWELKPKLTIHNKFQSKLRKIFTDNNYYYWNGYLVFTQLAWCLTIVFLLLSFHIDNYFAQLLKYSMFGGFLFLLIFEGDNTRYLIQFLPEIIILATYGLSWWQRNWASPKLTQ